MVPNQAVKQGKGKAKNPLAQSIIIENKLALQRVLSNVERRFVIGCCHSDEMKEEAWGALHSTKNSGLKFRVFYATNGTVSVSYTHLTLPTKLEV